MKKKGLIFVISAVIFLVLWNTVAFNIYNNIVSPTVLADISLNQMNGEDAILNTVGRLSAENQIWNICNWVANTISLVCVAYGGYLLYKSKKEAE